MTAEQGVRDSDGAVEASGVRSGPTENATGLAGLIQRVLALRPVRVFFHYSNDNGPLIASGMTYQAVFALFAALWFAFSVAGFVIAGNTALQVALFRAINGFIPNLIGYTTTSGTAVDGTIDSSVLLGTGGLTISGILSLVGVLYTAVGFLATLRTAIRIMFDLPNLQANFALQKAKDAGYAAAFGAVVLLTAAVSVVSNTALTFILGLLGLGDATGLEQVAATAISFIVIAAIDTAIVAAAFRILSGIPIPLRRLVVGALIGGIGLSLLQTVGASLLGGSRSNPLLTTFGTALGVLLYFNFVCQLLLIAASWISIGMQDAGISARSLTPEQLELEEAEQLEDARRLVARANREALEDRIRASSGLTRWRLSRELQREVRAEAQRRQRVPTAAEFERAQSATGDDSPDATQVREAGR